MKLLYEDESYKIRGACFNVYNTLGGGIQEKIIQRALFSELVSLGFNVNKEVKIDIIYKQQKIGTYIPDIIVNDEIIIEIKSKPFINSRRSETILGIFKRLKI